MPASRRFLDRLRQFNKRTFTPWILESAGGERSPFAVIGHVGRRSAKTYATPVIVRPVQDGFVFALTYGPGVDWYRNVLAAWACMLRGRGETYRLEQPEMLSVEAGLQAFPVPLNWVPRLNGIRDPALGGQAACQMTGRIRPDRSARQQRTAPPFRGMPTELPIRRVCDERGRHASAREGLHEEQPAPGSADVLDVELEANRAYRQRTPAAEDHGAIG